VKRPALLLVILAAGVSLLQAGLRPDSFFVGDQGVKLIAARNALDHPARPFEITLPSVGADRVPHVEPFFSVHGDHAHAVTSTLFPVLTAPLLSTLGLRGLYVLPALGFLLTVAGCMAVATALDHHRHANLAGLAAALGTPLLLYGLEYWEHTLALGCATLSIALMISARRFAPARAFGAGILMGAAALLRPETGWIVLAVLAASPWLPVPVPARAWFIALAGVIAAIAPFQVYTVVHFGTMLPPHVTANAAALGDGWAAERIGIAQAWLAGTSPASLWRAGPVAICAVLSLATRPARKGRAFLWVVTAGTVLLVLLTAPNDGGSQWGPRYLLFAYVPLSILAADALEALRIRNAAVTAGLTAAVLATLWVQRTAYRQLQGTKAMYGRIVDFVAAQTPAHGYVVTDLWWLDQVAASVTANRQMLFASDEETGRGIVQRLSDHVVPTITVLRSASESPDTGNWIGTSCYHEVQRDKISLRDLIAITLRHRCPDPRGSGS
jgi:hypothetical protein